LEKNPHSLQPPRIEQVEFLVVEDESTGSNLFERGKLDLLTLVPSTDFDRLKSKGLIQTTPYLTTYYLSFNCKKPPFQDRRWRQAFAGAIKRDEITAALGAGERPAWSWIPFGLEGYIPYQDPKKVFAESIEWAKKQDKRNTNWVAMFNTGSRETRILEKVQQDIHQMYGISLSLFPMDWKTYIKKVQTDAPPLFRLGWMAPFMDPISHLQVFTTGNPNNLSGFSSPQYDQWVDQIGKMSPGIEREKKIGQAQKLLLEQEAAVIPIYHYVQNTGVAKRVRGFRANPLGIVQFRDLSLESTHASH
jgi:oligopeptide transport system substrate-binding protein